MSRTRMHRPWIGAMVCGAFALVGVASAALLGVIPGLPQLTFDNQGAATYDAASDIFSVDATALAIRPIPGPFTSISTGEFFIDIEVDDTGSLVGGVPGDDLLVTGSVMLGGDAFAGDLLTGEIEEFGFADTGGTSDAYDFRFSLTGGALAPLYSGFDLVVVLNSEQSDFTGDFREDFGGEAKGTLGSTPAEMCGDGVLDPPEEQCDGGDDEACPGLCYPPDHPSACQCPSHFQCYEVDRDPFNGFSGIQLSDMFGSFTVELGRIKRHCNPANKNEEDPGRSWIPTI